MRFLIQAWLAERLQQLINICKGFWYWLTDDNRTKDLAKNRMIICNDCPEKQRSTCGVCGCILVFKTRVGDEDCPLGKW